MRNIKTALLNAIDEAREATDAHNFVMAALRARIRGLTTRDLRLVANSVLVARNDESTRCHFCPNDCARTFIDARTPDGRTTRYISGFSCEKGTVESVEATLFSLWIEKLFSPEWVKRRAPGDLSRALASIGNRDAAFPLPHGRGDEFHHGSPGRDPRAMPPRGVRPRDI
jgi:hypothetical protein